jgi:hypothetical protein
MPGPPRWYDNLPLTLAIGFAVLKAIPLLTMAGGTFPTVSPLTLFIRMDPLPWWVAQTSRSAVQQNPYPGAFELLVFAVVLIGLTAVQWYLIGMMVRNWLRTRGH